MVINDFSTLLQLAATLNIAFVAVEYAKAYTHTLSEKVFRFQDFIKESFQKCYDLLVDRETLDHMEPIIIEGKSTVKKIEKAKRDYEILKKEIGEKEGSLSLDVKAMCESKSLSSMSLWFFLYCTTALFFAGMDKICPNIIKHTWSTLFFCTIIFTILGSICGEREKQYKYADFSLLRHCVIYFIIIVAVSISCSFVFYYNNIYITDSFWNIILILSVLIPYVNFIIYALKTKNKAKEIKLKIKHKASDIEKKCNTLKTSVNDLLSVSKISRQLEIDE